MARCVRKKCQDSISSNPKAANMRLCDKHYTKYIQNILRRQLQSVQKCKYCHKSLADSKNKQYCSVEHRQLGSRKIMEQFIYDITHYSYWYHVQNAIKRNPLQLGSIENLDDIVDFINLYIQKSKHQRSYFLGTENKEGKATPLFELEVSHRYPNSKGGANCSTNMLISPSRINRMIKDSIPAMDQAAVFRGLKSNNKHIPMKGSLYEGLDSMFGLQKIKTSFRKVKRLRRFQGTILRHIEFSGVPESLPLLSLFTEEIIRLNNNYQDWLDIIQNIRKSYSQIYPLYIELLAALGFYAFLTGDRDRFLQRFFKFPEVKMMSSKHAVRHTGYGKFIALLIKKYMSRFFNVDTENPSAVVNFYNSLFTQEVVNYNSWSNELVFFMYQRGRKRQCSPPFQVLSALGSMPFRSVNRVLVGELELF